MSAGDPSLDPTLHSVALWCIACRKTSVWIGSAEHLHHAILGHLAICAATNRRPLGLLSRSWTRIYAAGLCRARNSAARTRPQRRQRQRRFAWSTFRLSGVSKWPLPQILGMAMGSRMRSREKHTTSVLVAPKHAPATNFNGLHRREPDCRIGPPPWQCPGSRYVNGLRTRTPVGAKWSTFRETTTRS